MRKRGSPPPPKVFTVTGLPESLRDDQDARMRRYLVSMGVRTTCFVLAVVAIVKLHWTVLGWVLVVAAVILPYIAVVMANASRSARGTYLGKVAPGTPHGQLASPVTAPPVNKPSDIDKDRPE